MAGYPGTLLSYFPYSTLEYDSTADEMANKDKTASQPFDTELSELYTFSDVIVKCDGKIWNLHRAILAQRCHWFKRALLGGFREGEENCINIGGWTKEQVGLVIEHIYRGPAEWKKLQGKKQTLTNHCMDVFNLADYFLLPDLKKSAEHAFGHMLFTMVVKVVHEVYSDEDSPASKAFRPILTMALHSAQYGLHKPTFAMLIEEVPTAAIDLLKFSLTERPSERTYPAKCSTCEKKIADIEVGFSCVTDKDGRLRGVCCRCDSATKKFGPF